MEKSNIAINTLVFMEDLKRGIKQSELLKTIDSLGIKIVEVRREFIVDFEVELDEIKTKSQELGIKLFYSVPKHLYVDGNINGAELEGYFKEAAKINAKSIKLNLGSYSRVSNEDACIVNSLCDKYGVRLTVENDQTEEGGRSQRIVKFLDEAKALKMNLSCTFDTGNWYWVKEEAKENASKLKAYVTYVHLKDVLVEGKMQGVLLDDGIVPWRDVIKEFEKDTPVAIEYPCYPNTIEILEKDIKKLEEI